MANLTVDPLKVKLVEAIEMYPMPAEVAVNAGQMGKLSTTTGKVNLALATTAPNARTIGMALTSTDRQPSAPTFLRRGIVDVGNALDALAYGADIFLSDTAGTLSDTAGTTSKIIGTVIPGYASTTPDKLLRIDV
jgi:hypothetical protein